MPIKAREIRERLKNKVDPDVRVILEVLAEEQGILHKQLMEMAQQLDQMTRILGQVVDVAHNMKNMTDKLKGMGGVHVDGEPTT